MRRILAVLAVTAAADTAWELLGAFWGFTVLTAAVTFAAAQLLTAAKQASSKAYVNSARIDAMVTTSSSLTSRVTTLETGTFVNVSGSTVNITGAGGGSLYIIALDKWINQNQVNYLNTISQQPWSTTVPGAPGSYNSGWGNGMVTALNNLIAACGNANILT